MNCTIFKNIYDKEPHYITVQLALERIKNGKSKDKVEEIRKTIDKEKSQTLKKNLPSICFSGTFKKRIDKDIQEHSGVVVIDFDNIENAPKRIEELKKDKFFYALWVSPSGNGIKGLIKIADGKKHREHFASFKEKYPEIDQSGVNESRVCYESYDPNIYINDQSEVWKKTLLVTKIESRIVMEDEKTIFDNLLKWQANKNGAFVKGERNSFIFKLASACCRFGLHEMSTSYFIQSNYPPSNDFSMKELMATIKSAYKSSSSQAGTAEFSKDILVDKHTRKEVEVEPREFDPNEPAKDVIYGSDVKKQALDIYHNGYAKVTGIGVEQIDKHFKAKKGELTLLTGHGNYGKSQWYKWFILNRILLFGEKFAAFCPEDNPPEEYYHDFCEMYFGRDCTPENRYDRPTTEEYDMIYDYITKHIFYLYPKTETPTATYIKERFLELIFKEKVSGVCIDPYNQLVHDYSEHGGGRSDKYLEWMLGEFGRFAQSNDIYFFILAHPTKMIKQGDGNYPCPDIYDIADGAMWNNKLDNILVYHRPYKQTDPKNPACEFHSKKIRRQKTVGKPGFILFEFDFKKRRFIFDGVDPISEILRQKEEMGHKRTQEPPIPQRSIPQGYDDETDEWIF